MTCPPRNDADGAKGYTSRFPADVTNGQLLGVNGTAGQPGWHRLAGAIAADGSATLRFEGIVNDELYAINKAARGQAYRYGVRAQFGQSSGSGERLTGRVCQFRFSR